MQPIYTTVERETEYDLLTEDECQEMRQAIELGWSVGELAGAYDICSATVHHHLDAACQHF